ncbi:hypothetical protein CBS9595_000202 [Malassezia furfur]|nr:hypothetical protein CBS9595_000202 [Malassezia furfur]
MIGYTDPTSLAKQDKGKALANKPVDTASIQQAKAWEAAIAPVKSIPMNLMMLYMSGNSVQIFSMMVVYMTVVNPLKGITTVNADARVHRVPARVYLRWPVQVLEHGSAPDRG